MLLLIQVLLLDPHGTQHISETSRTCDRGTTFSVTTTSSAVDNNANMNLPVSESFRNHLGATTSSHLGDIMVPLFGVLPLLQALVIIITMIVP